MTPELTALAVAVLVQIATLGTMSVIANRELGTRVTAGPRDGQMPQVSRLLGRMLRAVTNGFEGLAMFTPAVLLVTVAGEGTAVTAAAAWVYVGARILYVPAYARGWVPWRSAIWGVGLAAIITLILAALI